MDAGVSADVEALVGRLSAELERSGALVGRGPVSRDVREAVRAEAERLWPVTAEQPLEPRPGLRGRRRPRREARRPQAVRWYVEPLFADQRAFNDAVLKLIDDLDERVARLEGDEQLAVRIAVCAPQVPFVRGGAEIFAERLAPSSAVRGHEAELVTIPFKWYPGARVLSRRSCGGSPTSRNRTGPRSTS